MAAYFGFDHVVWAAGVGLVDNKQLVEKAQEWSFYGWLLSSLLGLAADAAGLRKLRASASRLASLPSAPGGGGGGGDEAGKAKGAGEGEAARRTALAKTEEELSAKLVSLAGLATQAALAASLLKLIHISPRATGVLGVTTSALAVYQLLPPLPAKPKAD